MAYAITLADSARKELRSFPSHVVERVFPKLRELATNPRPSGCKKLHGEQNSWRIRVGDYRIVYSIDDEQKLVDVVHIARRKEVYEP